MKSVAWRHATACAAAWPSPTSSREPQVEINIIITIIIRAHFRNAFRVRVIDGFVVSCLSRGDECVFLGKLFSVKLGGLARSELAVDADASVDVGVRRTWEIVRQGSRLLPECVGFLAGLAEVSLGQA